MNAVTDLSNIQPDLSHLIALRQQAAHLQLFSKKTVSTENADNYASNAYGRGMDFEEVRIYQPGDDIRNIDWRVTARRGTVHTKVFREERERPVLFYLNVSDSMRFGTRVAFKSVIAARLCSLLAWAAVERGDRVGGVVVAGEKHGEIKPRTKQHGVLPLLQTIVEACHWPGHLTSESCRQHLLRLLKVSKPGALVVLLTDCYAWDPSCWTVLARISERCQVNLIHVYDPLEAMPPKPNEYMFTDGLKKILLNTQNKKICSLYKDQFEQRKQVMRDHCLKSAVKFTSIATHSDLSTELRNLY
ncbi:MAG: hypothetical protein A3F17_04520 [Gammaproteobacteria bacterium RIFCSPHIGHO2_12_FULL_41_15]|nr:MAG: hypothetical protein A3F17_04520 [Gammaproteobacteria bacterium RIFCSPHIGHO2_12_FULL_41_15]